MPPVGAGAERRWAEFLEIPTADLAALEASESSTGCGTAVVVPLMNVRHLYEGEFSWLGFNAADIRSA